MMETDVQEIRSYYLSLKPVQNGGTSIQLIADLWGLKKDDIKPLIEDLMVRKKYKRQTTSGGKKKTKEELDIARAKIPSLVKEGWSDRMISREVGCSQSWVSDQRRALGMRANYEKGGTWRNPNRKKEKK